tara:strand:- start:2045 stop:2446 length:402 start_codon:yes stop_codon:yes gene_type:complete
MGQFAMPLLIASSVLGAKASLDAGKAAQQTAKAQAEQEKMAAADRQIARNEELIKTMAESNVAQAAGGGGGGGSYAAGQRESMRQAELGRLSDTAQVAARTRALSFGGAQARRQGRFKAAGTLLGGIGGALSA